MRILLIAQEPPLDPTQVVTGNALRAAQLTGSLEAHGHEVRQVWLSKERQRRPDRFRNRDELRSLLLKNPPDVLLVSYWQLLELLPLDSEIPLILDFVAPRPLEELFQLPGEVSRQLRLLRLGLSRADLVLVGNEQQAPLLFLPLIEAGLDLREDLPVAVVPLAAPVVKASRANPESSGWTLAAGGVDWPWRKAGDWLGAVRSVEQPGLQLVLFGGDYQLHAESGKQDTAVARRPLEPYAQYSAFLGSEAHIGLELSDDNIERRFAQSFRSLDFLRHGLPLICNRFLPIAAAVDAHDAGWVVDTPGELPDLLRKITSEPAQWREKSGNALRLVAEEFDPAKAAKPLLNWLNHPRKAARLPKSPEPPPAVLGVPPLGQRLRRILKLARQVALGKLFGGKASAGVLMVTRGDLFPPDHGAAVKIVETARGIAGHDTPVALVTDERKYWWLVENGRLERRRVPWYIRLFAMPLPLAKLLHFSKDIPQDSGFLYLPLSDRSYFWRILCVGRTIGARVLQAEFPAYARPCLDARPILGTKVVMVEHNVEYERLREQVAGLSDDQYRRYRAIEIDLCRRCDAVVCVSDNDFQRLAADGVDMKRLHVVPHGVDLGQFSGQASLDVRSRFDIPETATLLVFHGTFAYPPNTQALQAFAGELLPRLDTLGLECHVLAVGRQPPPNSPHPRIHLAGSVEVVAPWLKAADIAVVPLLEGGGTRMKIIDYFAAGLPVISTSKGIEGIPARDGEDVLIIDDWDEMAEAIASLARDPDRARQLGENGHALARELDWSEIGRRYLELFRLL